MHSNNPEPLASRVAARTVPPGRAAAWWLGGSGVVIKSPSGTVIYVDPYLSDSVREIFGVGRAFPPPLRPEEVRAHAVVSTHWHEDHLDPGTIPVIARNCPETQFIMPPSAMARALSWGVPRGRITPLVANQEAAVGEVRVSHAPARHEAGIAGVEVPDAMGVILEVEGLSIYHSGDTEYDLRLRRLRSRKLDAAFVCINGITGNMNALEAALLVYQLGCGTVVPVHHYLWANPAPDDEATLDPRLFEETYRKLGGAGAVVIPEVGGEIGLRLAG